MTEFYMNSMTLASNCHFPQPQFRDMSLMHLIISTIIFSLWYMYLLVLKLWLQLHLKNWLSIVLTPLLRPFLFWCYHFSKYLASTHLIFCKGYSRSHAVLVSIVVLHSFNRVRPSGISTEKAFALLSMRMHTQLKYPNRTQSAK